MRFVKITQDTRTEHGEYFAGERRKVTDEQADDLLGKGWAEAESAVLDVHNSRLGVKTKVI